MQQYITDIIASGAHGLFLCELPTGYGKTYTFARIMRALAEDPRNRRKILYLTTLNKNLPAEELLAAFDGDQARYERAVLQLRANLDAIAEHLEELDIPAAVRPASYEKLLRLVCRWNRCQKQSVDGETLSDLRDRLDQAERGFRKELRKKLTAQYHTKAERLNAIQSDPLWKWVGVLYPAVFTEIHSILLLSVSKFMRRNSVIIEHSYPFLNARFLEDAIIFIDEFDATKATIQQTIIEQSLATNAEYLELFRTISRSLNPAHLSRSMTQAYQSLEQSGRGRCTFDAIRRTMSELERDYSLHLSYKTVEAQIDRRQNFLFKDATYHTLSEPRCCVRGSLDPEENCVSILFETREDYGKNKRNDPNSIEIYGMLRKMASFFMDFRTFVHAWAAAYQKQQNTGRSASDDILTQENAVSSILIRLGLTRPQQLIMGELLPVPRQRKQRSLLPDNSFYQQGMEIFSLEDSDTHLDSTDLRLVKVSLTPEKVLLSLAERATVFAISATAEVPSVVGNYDLNYLSEQLGEAYHPTPLLQKDHIRQALAETWRAYREQQIQVRAEVIRTRNDTDDLRSICRQLFSSRENALICHDLICATGASSYHLRRYCNLVEGMRRFLASPKLQSMLYLGMALPKHADSGMDLELLEQLKELLEEDLGGDAHMSLAVLRSDHFEEEKAGLLERLAKGEKLLILSTYQTIGAGQNLQYPVKNTEHLVRLLPDQQTGDKRHTHKDIDALYLGDLTYLTINTYQENEISQTELLELLFQIESLKHSGELNYEEAEAMIRLAFRAASGQCGWQRNLLYQQPSVKLQATRAVMQAVGRMCRTYLKSPEILLMIEDKLLEKLSAGELRKHILPPELEAIVRLREQLGTEYSNETQRLLNQAEIISSSGMWTIRQILSRRWTEDSMQLWSALRKLVLTHPTASASLWADNELVHQLYITSGTKQDRYLFSQYADFSNVVIDFSNDPVGFRNSKRAKRHGETGQPLVYTFSQEAAGLTAMMRHAGLQEHFVRQGYACSFTSDDYLMSPVLFHNIYKGALGEAAGRFLLREALGIELQPITDPERFEFFDYELSPDVYVDFKNWKFSYLQDRETVHREILQKLEHIGGKRVYIINILQANHVHIPTIQKDRRIVEIPCLLDQRGHLVWENLNILQEEDHL